LKGDTAMSMFDDIWDKFQRLEDGFYSVRIEDYIRKPTRFGDRPIRWVLTVLDDVKGILPTKFSHIESEGGFKLLLSELKQLGLHPTNPHELEQALNSLKGAMIEVALFTDGDHQNIRFVRRKD
jgi:hypothetical protein